jgi:hypothetical protein
MGKILQFRQKPKPGNAYGKTDRQVIDAVELLIEYAYECGGDVETVVSSKELAEVVRSLHVMFGKMNGMRQQDLDLTKDMDLTKLYNSQGYLDNVDKSEE